MTQPSRTPLLSDRQGFDRRWFANNLQRVYAPQDAQGVIAALADAETSGFGPGTVQPVSGRHCYEDFVYSPNTQAIIDCSMLRGIGIDDQYGYWIGTGNNNWAAYSALLNGFNRTIPAGSCYSVGIGGHICGGGYGVLSRLHGLTVDWLTGVDVVVRIGKGKYDLVHASADDPDQSVRDLFWAHCGGGGGNFGVITRYYFKQLPVPPQSCAIDISPIPWTAITGATELGQAISFFEQTYTDQQKYWNTWAIFKLSHRAAGQIAIVSQTFSDLTADELREEFGPVAKERREQLSSIVPLDDHVNPIVGHPVWLADPPNQIMYYTFLEAMQQMNGSGPNRRGKYKSAYMKQRFPFDQVIKLFNWLTTPPPPFTDFTQSLCQVDAYGGAINQKAPDATAIPQRSSIMKLQYQTYWQTSDKPGTPDPVDEPHLAWIRGFYNDMYGPDGPQPDDVMDGCYYNYPDVDLGDNALSLYFQNNLDRLKATKARWDKDNYFRHAQSIPLP